MKLRPSQKISGIACDTPECPNQLTFDVHNQPTRISEANRRAVAMGWQCTHEGDKCDVCLKEKP